MKCAYSFAAVFVMLMSWQTLAANPPPDHADALYGRVMDLYGQRRFAEAEASYERSLAIREQHFGQIIGCCAIAQ